MTKVVGLPKETRAETAESTALDDIDPPTQMTISMEVDPLQERVPVCVYVGGFVWNCGLVSYPQRVYKENHLFWFSMTGL